MVPPMSVTCCCDSISEMTGVVALGLELGTVGCRRDAADVARELDDRDLHAEADAEERQAVLAGLADRLDHALDAAHAEPAGNEQAVDTARAARAGRRLVGEAVARDPLDVDLTSFAMPP